MVYKNLKLMKKLLIIALALFTLQVSAQQGNKESKREHARQMQDLTPEESATLRAKHMTLNLDLSEKQQEQVYNLLLQGEKEREQMRAERKSQTREQKLSKEEKLERQNARLDKQIDMKKKMKEILNAEQYAKWEKLMESKKRDFKGKQNMKPRG